MLEISLVIITFNAERHLRRVLSSAGFAAETVIVDCGSSDRTLEICRESGARLFEREWAGYGAQKNFALAQARCPWVLSLDADEVVSPELAREIAALDDRAPFAGYRIPRLNHYFGRPLRYGGQFPDYQLRLFKKSLGRYNDRPVHESVELQGAAGRLSGALLHFSYDTLADYFAKFSRYTDLEAARLLEAGEKPGPWSLILHLLVRPATKFIRRYFFKLGFLDGVPGLLAALFNSFAIIVSYAKAWEKSRQSAAGPQRPDR
jgi:glycosyltransferase involved in cell wall biosynthesis